MGTLVEHALVPSTVAGTCGHGRVGDEQGRWNAGWDWDLRSWQE